MGLFDLFKKKKPVNANNQPNNKLLTSTTKPVENTKQPTTTVSSKSTTNYQIKPVATEYVLTVHQDIKDLLWFADGEHKNFVSTTKVVKLGDWGEIRTTLSEPSAIYMNKSISRVNDVFKVDKMDYFPTYEKMTPEQRFVYWNYLKNPYDNRYDVGYAFVLYYGLERYMTIPDKFEQAFDIVLKLRDVFDNKSFQTYTSKALILLCNAYRRIDLFHRFLDSIDKDYESIIDSNLWFLTLQITEEKLCAKHLIDHYKCFDFNNSNYIKKYPSIFEEEMDKLIEEKYPNGLVIDSFIKRNEYAKMQWYDIAIFCNSSLEQELRIPYITEAFKFKMAIYQVFEQTHDAVKERIKNERKSGTLVEPVKEVKEETIVVATNYDAINIEGYDPYNLNNIPMVVDSLNDKVAYFPEAKIKEKQVVAKYKTSTLIELEGYKIQNKLFNSFTDYEKKIVKAKLSEKPVLQYYAICNYIVDTFNSHIDWKSERVFHLILLLLPECIDKAFDYLNIAFEMCKSNSYYKAYAYTEVFNVVYGKNCSEQELVFCANAGMKAFELVDEWITYNRGDTIALDFIWISLCNCLKKLKRYDEAIAIASKACELISNENYVYGQGWQDRLAKLVAAKEKKK